MTLNQHYYNRYKITTGKTTDVGNHIVDLLQHSRKQAITDHTSQALENMNADKTLSDLKNIMPSLQELMKIASHRENWKGMRETAQTAIKSMWRMDICATPREHVPRVNGPCTISRVSI